MGKVTMLGCFAAECTDWLMAASLSLTLWRISAADLSMLACLLTHYRGNYAKGGCADVECGNYAEGGSTGADVIVAMPHTHTNTHTHAYMHTLTITHSFNHSR